MNKLKVATKIFQVTTLALRLKEQKLFPAYVKAVTSRIYEKQAAEFEKLFVARVSPLFAQQIQSAIKNLRELPETALTTAAGIREQIFNPAEWDHDLVQAALPVVAKSMSESSIATFRQLTQDINRRKKWGEQHDRRREKSESGEHSEISERQAGGYAQGVFGRLPVDSGRGRSDECQLESTRQFCPTGPGGGIDPTCGSGGGGVRHGTGVGKPLAIVLQIQINPAMDFEEVSNKHVASSPIGKALGLSEDDLSTKLGALIGIPASQTATVLLEDDGKRLTVMSGDELDQPFEMTRSFVITSNGKVICHNSLFRIHDEIQEQKPGTGIKAFRDQVDALTEAGVSEIHTDAAGDWESRKEWNGYYTWPLVGYDKALTTHDLKHVVEDDPKYTNMDRISDIYATEEGREYWKKNGQTLSGLVFDLTPGSDSHARLDDYINRRKAENRPIPKAFCPTGAGGGIDPSCGSGVASETNTVEFKAWFAGSKVVDDSGKPLVVYHGSPNDFDQFKGNTHNAWSDSLGFDTFFHSESPATASTYANQFPSGVVKSSYLSIKNPLVLDMKGAEWFDALAEAKDSIPTYRTPQEFEFEQHKKQHYEKYNYESEFEPDKIPQEAVDALEAASRKVTRHILDNPELYATAKRKPFGYDGIVVHNVLDNTAFEPTTDGESYSPYTTVYVAFDPSQIRNVRTTSKSFEKRGSAAAPAPSGANCGIGPGGFLPGNQCARGGSGGASGGGVGLSALWTMEKPDVPRLDPKSRKPSVADGLRYLQGLGKRDIKLNDPKLAASSISEMAKALADDVSFAYKETDAEAGWYSSDIRKTYVLASQGHKNNPDGHPELHPSQQSKAAKEAKFIFATCLALTSPGEDVLINGRNAEFLYRQWKKSGTTNETRVLAAPNGFSKSQKALPDQLKMLQTLIESKGKDGKRRGITGVAELMSKTVSGKEVQELGLEIFHPELVGKKISAKDRLSEGKLQFKGEVLTSELPVFSIFGPKLGAFFSNIRGNMEPVTIDLWETRHLSALAGHALNPMSSKSIKSALDRFSAAREEIHSQLATHGIDKDKFEAELKAMEGPPLQQPEPNGAIAEWTKKQWKVYEKSQDLDHKPNPRKSYGAKTKANTLANTMIKNLSGIHDAPTSAEKRNIRKIFKEATQLLRDQGIDTSPAEVQAVSWTFIQRALKKTGANVDIDGNDVKTGEKVSKTFSNSIQRVLDGKTPFFEDWEHKAQVDREITAAKNAGKKSFVVSGVVLADESDGDSVYREYGEKEFSVEYDIEQIRWGFDRSQIDDPEAQALRLLDYLEERNEAELKGDKAFCPTGPGGGIDPTCSPGQAGRSGGSASQKPKLDHNTPLKGLPQKPITLPGFGEITPGPFPTARAAAERYMKKTGLPYDPPTEYVKVDKERAAKVAAEYDRMKHDPQDPEVKAAYSAMLKETMAQWEEMKATGLVVQFNNPGENPYPNPRMATEDVRQNNRLFVFPTIDGFGTSTDFDPANNPLLGDSGERWNGQVVTYNDIFRAVHDYYGHIKEGNGFRADGEENAWRSHSAMYSPLARLAMTSETRGQNSWLNYGPHGEHNRTAKVEDTFFADQKTGIMPVWVSIEGAKYFGEEDYGTEIRSKRTGGDHETPGTSGAGEFSIGRGLGGSSGGVESFRSTATGYTTGAGREDEKQYCRTGRGGGIDPTCSPGATRVLFEAAPDPHDRKLVDRWHKLSSGERTAISQRVVKKMLPRVLKAAGVDAEIKSQFGGYLDDTNPSFAALIPKGVSSSTVLNVAKMTGFTLSQDSMMVVSKRKMAGADKVGLVTVHIPDGLSLDQVHGIYKKLRTIDGGEAVQGHTTVGKEMMIVDFSGDSQNLAKKIESVLGTGHTIGVSSGYVTFPHKKEYGYDDHNGDGSELAGRRRIAHRLRSEASRIIDREISRYEHERPRKEFGADDGGTAGHDDGRADGFASVRMESRGSIRWSGRADTGGSSRVAGRDTKGSAAATVGANCGIGPGGFQPGNQCARGGSGGASGDHTIKIRQIVVRGGRAGGVENVVNSPIGKAMGLTEKNFHKRLGALVGAIKGTEFDVSLSIDARHLSISAPDTEDYLMDRTFFVNMRDEVTATNDYFKILRDKAGVKDRMPPGTGTKMFRDQVRACTKAGFKHIITDAAGSAYTNSDGKGFNGYNTWPKCGYDRQLAGPEKDRMRNHPNVESLKTVADLVATPEGRKYWKEHGFALDGLKFDLQPGSPHHKRLEAYLARREAEGRPIPKAYGVKASTATEWLNSLDDRDIDLADVVFSTPYGDVSMSIATEYPIWMKRIINDRLQDTFAQSYWAGINDTTAGDIESVLTEGMLDGWSIRDMANEMEDRYGSDEYPRSRGRNIARTEAGNALNGTRSQVIDELIHDLGMEDHIKKLWLSVLGSTTRDTHANLDGVPADKDGCWALGGVRCRWPGDVRLPAGERCNCQCTVVTSFGMENDEADELIAEYELRRLAPTKTFCATGAGGGIDPTCSPGKASVGHTIEQTRELRVKALDFFHEQLTEHYNNAPGPRVSAEQAKHYLREAASCFKQMNGKSIESFLAHVNKIKFYPDPDELTVALGYTREMIAKTKTRAMGAYERYDYEAPEGTLHLDGDYGLRSARSVYAHEFGHVLDWKINRNGKGSRISDSKEWKQAHWEELSLRQLTDYAATSPAEGFAEVHRRLLSAARNIDAFPKCKAIFEKHGLL